MDAIVSTLGSRDRELYKRLAGLVFVLGCCSFACCFVLLTRRVMTGERDFRFLVWNLILAWAPLVFAGIAHWAYASREVIGRRGWLVAFLTLWLLFFPNAPYLVSDLKHLSMPRPEAPLWFDSVLVGSFVLTGITAGFASLVLVHDLARRRFGAAGAWALISLASVASGFAIYLGRFVRLNSWDVLTRPGWSAQMILRQFTGHDAERTLQTTVMYSGFIALGYVAVMMLAHLVAATVRPVDAGRPLTSSTTSSAVPR
jgi:uncharacterized membrane protein